MALPLRAPGPRFGMTRAIRDGQESERVPMKRKIVSDVGKSLSRTSVDDEPAKSPLASSSKDLDDRAADLLDRLTDLGWDAGLTETDLHSRDTREPFRSLAKSLALAAECAGPLLSCPDLRGLVAAANGVRAAAASQSAAGGGGLDQSLLRLLRSLHPASPCVARIEVLEALVALVQCSRMLALGLEKDPEAKAAAEEAKRNALPAEDLRAARAVSAALRGLTQSLGLQVPPPNTDALQVLNAAGAAATAVVAQLPPSIFEPLVPRGSLAGPQLATLAEVDAALRREYGIRRRMLVERARVTLRSFAASPRIEEKGLEAELKAAIEEGEARLGVDPSVRLDDVFESTLGDLMDVAARATSGDRMFQASVKGVLIGAVPDRGGRAEGKGREAYASANFPQWKARSEATEGPQSSGGGRGGGGRGGGGGREGGGGGGRHNDSGKGKGKGKGGG